MRQFVMSLLRARWPGLRGRKATVLMSLWRDERGVTLVLSLMALMVLGAASAIMLSIGSSEVQIAANHLGGAQAQFLAEAGVEDAFNSFRIAGLSNPPATLTAVPGLSGPGTALGAFGTYAVQYQSAGPNTVLVVSTGTSATSGAQKVIRATMSTGFISNNAVMIQDDFRVSGNPTINGSCGNTHANGDLEISGNPTITGDATASGSYSASGNPSIGGTSGGGLAQQTIPPIDPADFLTVAKSTLPANQVFQMNSNGQVLDGADSGIASLSNGDKFQGWEYKTGGSTPEWRHSGNTGIDGTYYFQGDVKVSGNPGSPTTPWATTLIATGDIEISGNPNMSPHLPDTLFVAGLDIKISGNTQTTFNGLIAAHEQIRISGNPSIDGYVIAEDATSTSSLVNENRISGNPTITYNCALNPPLQGPLQILAWGL